MRKGRTTSQLTLSHSNVRGADADAAAVVAEVGSAVWLLSHESRLGGGTRVLGLVKIY